VPKIVNYHIDEEFDLSDFSSVVESQFSIISDYVVESLNNALIVEGLIIKGHFDLNSKYMLGPDTQGQFSLVKIIGIEEHRVSCNKSSAGKAACFRIEMEGEEEKKEEEGK
jgi:GTPase